MDAGALSANNTAPERYIFAEGDPPGIRSHFLPLRRKKIAVSPGFTQQTALYRGATPDLGDPPGIRLHFLPHMRKKIAVSPGPYPASNAPPERCI